MKAHAEMSKTQEKIALELQNCVWKIEGLKWLKHWSEGISRGFYGL